MSVRENGISDSGWPKPQGNVAERVALAGFTTVRWETHTSVMVLPRAV